MKFTRSSLHLVLLRSCHVWLLGIFLCFTLKLTSLTFFPYFPWNWWFFVFQKSAPLYFQQEFRRGKKTFALHNIKITVKQTADYGRVVEKIDVKRSDAWNWRIFIDFYCKKYMAVEMYDVYCGNIHFVRVFFPRNFIDCSYSYTARILMRHFRVVIRFLP